MPRTNDLIQLVKHNLWDQALIEIQRMTVDERAELCNMVSDFSDNNSEYSVLLWVILNNQFEIAVALLKDLTPEQRIDICNFVSANRKEVYSALALAYENDCFEIINALTHDLMDYHRLQIKCFGLTGHDGYYIWRGYTLYSIAIIRKSREVTASLLSGLTPAERTTLCNAVIISGPYKGDTNLTLALMCRGDDIVITMLQGQSKAAYKKYCTSVIKWSYSEENNGHTALTVAINNYRNTAAVLMLHHLDADIRTEICKTLISEGENCESSVLLLAIRNKLDDVITALLKDLSDIQIDSIFAANLFHEKSVLDTFVLYNAFENEILLGYAMRRNLNLREITLNAFDLTFKDEYGRISRRGIDQAVKYSPYQNLTLEDRKKYLVNIEDKPIPNMSGIVLYTIHDFIDLSAWLHGFTQNEKRLALTQTDADPDDDNALMIDAFEYGNLNLVNWLVTQGIALPEGYRDLVEHDGIQYGQSIHNAAVHKSVGDSLIALKKSYWLSDVEVNNTITALINLANSLPDSTDNSNIKAVAKRALLRITTEKFLIERELRSGLSVAEILAYFFINLIKIKDPIKRNDALDVFYNQLFTIQRDYNSDATGADGTICVGGTLNQLSIALQEVCPDLVWVVFASNKGEALKGLTFLPEILIKAFMNSHDKSAYAKFCANMAVDKIVPDELWPFIEYELKLKLIEGLYNRNMTPHRCALEHNSEVNYMVTTATNIIKAGNNRTTNESFTREMHQPGQKIKELVEDIAYSAGDDKKFAEARKKRLPRSIEATQKLCLKLTLDPSILVTESDRQKANPKKTSRGIQELYLHSRTTALKPLYIDIERKFIHSCKKYASKKLPTEKLPDSFIMIATDRQLLEKLLTAIQDANYRNNSQIKLDLIFEESETAMKWLAIEDDFKKTMEILEIVELESGKDKNEYINENSCKLYQALLHFAPEMIKQSIKNETLSLIKSEAIRQRLT